ncbi:hypothetical protein [Protofrankia symbiont of Coriaria ruscifolia]|uniref:hypothetical protein n=1 Tax=Protofrankia symbiont of Coriaria ruscifolia TaxID=1306542 RepID=UPI0013EF7B9C|nr:hypothetical protein [Protofrankia symbiont of Coriaria ruscifolia]
MTAVTAVRTWRARAVLALLIVAVSLAHPPARDGAGGSGGSDRAAHAHAAGAAGAGPDSADATAVAGIAGAGDVAHVGYVVDAGSDTSPGTPITLGRGSSPYTLTVRSQNGGEGVAEVTAQAPGADWAVRGAESAVFAITVDGKPATDVVVPFEHPIASRVQLGHVSAGAHTLTIALDERASASGAHAVVLRDLSVSVVAPRASGEPDPLAYAPILYGRSLPEFGGPFQNNHTDTPLFAWHTQAPVAGRRGHTLLEYSVMFSNEDGGTGADPASLQARWGRQTDIEWVYRVELDAAGSVVPGSAVYQAPSHTALPFAGRYEDGHPVLQTCTSNNMVCDVITDPGMRFVLAVDHELAAGEAREQMMDTVGWTYQVSAAEVRREEKIEPVASAYTPALSDPRNYLYVVIRKTTSVPVASVDTGLAWVGATVGVRLAGAPDVLYRSDHMIPGWSLQRDGLVATAVELPAGTRLDDIATLEVLRAPASVIDPGSTVTVTGVERAIMLDADALPASGSLTWSGTATLTASDPSSVLLSR